MSAWQLAPRYNHTYSFPDTPIKDHDHFLSRPMPPAEPRHTTTLGAGFRKFTPLQLKNTQNGGPPSPGTRSPRSEKDLALAKIDYGGPGNYGDSGKIRGTIRLYSDPGTPTDLPWTSAARKPLDNEFIRDTISTLNHDSHRYDAPSARDIHNWSSGKENDSYGHIKVRQYSHEDVRGRLDTADLAVKKSLRLSEGKELDLAGYLANKSGEMTFHNPLPKQGRYPDLPVPKRYDKDTAYSPWRAFKGHAIPSPSDLVTASVMGSDRTADSANDRSGHPFSIPDTKNDYTLRQQKSRTPMRPWTPHVRYNSSDQTRPPTVDFDRSRYMFSRGNTYDSLDRTQAGSGDTKAGDSDSLLNNLPSRKSDLETKAALDGKTSTSISYNSHRIYANGHAETASTAEGTGSPEYPPSNFNPSLNVGYQRPPPPTVTYDDYDHHDDNVYERIDTRFTNSIGASIGNLKPSSPSSKPGSPSKSILKKAAKREVGLSRSNTFHGHGSRDVIAGAWNRPSLEAHGFPHLGGGSSGGLKRSSSVKKVTFIV